MDEGDDEYVDPNLYSAFGVGSVLNVPASPIRESPRRYLSALFRFLSNQKSEPALYGFFPI